MNDERPRTSQDEAEGGTSGEQGRVGAPDMSGCCGPEMAEMTEVCSCGSFLKKHRLIASAAIFLIFLMFVISQVGGILGIIAFFRTL